MNEYSDSIAYIKTIIKLAEEAKNGYIEECRSYGASFDYSWTGDRLDKIVQLASDILKDHL